MNTGTNIIEKTLKENIRNANNIFVFPTQMAADRWADRATLVCNVSAVAMDRFLAWDDFKGKSVKSKQQEKKSVPSIMRKIFSANLIERNKNEKFLSYIITHEYAEESDGFTNWISSILPSLALWKKHSESSGLEKDEEDKDLEEIYTRYKEFLDSNNLFDPAWETPPFENDGNHYFIFFPEILSDYLEYKTILEETEDITQIHVPENTEEKYDADFYGNSRTETRKLAAWLRKKHSEGISWQEMCVSIPNTQTYIPYITRDFDIYGIPYVTRESKPLASTGAGNLFSLIRNCAGSDFSFESVKNLLLSSELPWKDEDLNKQLIEFGKQNNCITSFDYNGRHYDIWEESFRTVSNTEVRLKNFYSDLKTLTQNLCNSESFRDVQKNYFNFREKFFDMDKCSDVSDAILSRCISELGNLIDLENSYKKIIGQMKEKSYLSFFNSVLEDAQYLAQTKNLGVTILPYRTSACAPFEVQAIVDASQKGLSVIYKELSFLRDDKRKLIIFGKDSDEEDPNVTKNFISLYKMNSINQCRFSASSKTFDGYAQVCSDLNEVEHKTESLQELEEDFILCEKNWYSKNSSREEAKFPEKISRTVKDGFDFWKDSQIYEKKSGSGNEEYKKYFYSEKDNKLYISASSLKAFSRCPREQVFARACEIEEQNNEAELISPFTIGNMNHKVLELYFCQLKKLGMEIYVDENGELPEENIKILSGALDKAIDEEMQRDYDQQTNKNKNSFLTTELLWTTRNAQFMELKNSLQSFSKIFSGCKVYSTEEWYNLPARCSVEFENEKNILAGKVDLILSNENGEPIVVDYKTSDASVPEKTFIKNGDEDNPDLQMAMYIKLIEYNNGKNPHKIFNSCFYSIKEAKAYPVIADSDFLERCKVKEDKVCDREEFQLTLDYLDKTITDYESRIENNDFSVDKDEQNFETCSSCKYKAVCRRSFNISRGE